MSSSNISPGKIYDARVEKGRLVSQPSKKIREYHDKTFAVRKMLISFANINVSV